MDSRYCSAPGSRRIVCSTIDFKILLISFKAPQHCKLISELFATTPFDTYFDIAGPEVVANARLTAESVCRKDWKRSGSADLNLLERFFCQRSRFRLRGGARENLLVRRQEETAFCGTWHHSAPCECALGFPGGHVVMSISSSSLA